MRTLTFVALIAVTPLISACAVIEHVYVAPAIAVLPYRDRALSRATAARAGITLDAFPTWAFGVSYTHALHPDSARYIEPKCSGFVNGNPPQAGCFPRIVTSSTGFDVQKRWEPTQRLHTFASLTLGQVTSGDFYVPSDARRGYGVVDSTRNSPFVTLAGGGELNLTPWLHVTLAAGYRGVSRQVTTNGNDDPSGFTLSSLLIVGKPYRDP